MKFAFNVLYPARDRRDAGDGRKTWDRCLAAARAAEEAPFDSVWYSVHFMFGEPGGEVEVELLECFTALGALAACTERVRLGPYVLVVPYRTLALTAKAFTSFDVMSHGRAIVIISAAWHRAEFDAYGWPFTPVRERMGLLEDAVHITEAMMTCSPASYAGKHASIEGAPNFPRPVQRPRPPLLMGGEGEKRTLRLVAQYADMANIWGGEPDYVRHKFEVLREHCEAIGRDYDEIERSNHVSVLLASDKADLEAKRQKSTDFPASPPLSGTPQDVIAGLRAFADAGSQYIIVDLADWEEIDTIHHFGEAVIPALRESI